VCLEIRLQSSFFESQTSVYDLADALSAIDVNAAFHRFGQDSFVWWPTRPGHSLLLPRSSVIRSRPVSSVNTHFVRTQCDLGKRLSKFTTELMAGKWEWGVTSEPIQSSPKARIGFRLLSLSMSKTWWGKTGD